MACSLPVDDAIESLANSLLRNSEKNHRKPNTEIIARIVAAQRTGHGCLPLHLGLEMHAFSSMMRWYFPGSLFWLALHSRHDEALQRGALRQQLLALRHDEWRDIRDLLLGGRRGDDICEEWLASIVAAGCMGCEHLWRDLGLASRAQLGELLRHNFPGVALRNDRDMKWKKFFYKQLCEQQGSYVCRSPSCEQCVAYQDCFGPEQ